MVCKKCAVCLMFMLMLTFLFSFVPAFTDDSFSYLSSFAEAQSTEFVYREGVMFGMSVNQVKKLEKNAPGFEGLDTYGTPQRYYLSYPNEKTLTYQCEIRYYFTDNSLEQISVDIYINMNRPDTLFGIYDEIQGALAMKYGSPDGSPELVVVPRTSVTNYVSAWSCSAQRNYQIQHTIVTTDVGVRHGINYWYRLFEAGDI